jgi:hypothetical protein
MLEVLPIGMGWAEGFEPSTTGTTIRRSTKLSYAHRVKGPLNSTKLIAAPQIRCGAGCFGRPGGESRKACLRGGRIGPRS